MPTAAEFQALHDELRQLGAVFVQAASMVGERGRGQRSGGHCSRRYRESAEGMMPYSIPAPTAAKKAAGTAYAVAAKAS